MDKLGFSLRKLGTLLVFSFITFSLLLIFSVKHQNSIFDFVAGFPNRSLTSSSSTVLKEGASNITVKTESAVGPKNHSLEDQKKEDTSLSSTSIANDQLLDGLLVSAFEEASCLSRFQSHLYRKASPYKPSAYLISKLRNYENLHTSCGPRTKSYNKVMTKGPKLGKNDAGTNCKYLVWTASNGLGNRMITLVAAFLYAILTDRVLLVKFGTDMFGLFCEPFPNSSWLLPRNFPYWKDQKHIETYENIMNSKKYRSEGLLPQFLILNLQHTHDGHNNFFHCDRSQGFLQKVSVLILSSDQYFVPSLFMIPSFTQELSKMFPKKDTVFHHLGRYLFHPSNEAWELISRFYEEHLAKENEKIGLQIRVYNTHRASHETIINEILACTHQHKLLPDIGVPKTSVTSVLKKQTSKAVLVASLYSEYGEKLRTMYKANTTVTGEVINVYQPSHEGRQKSNNDTHNIKAWAEIYLLSLCDALITSPKSTFGYVAHSLGGLKPWILERAYGENIPNPPCRRAKSMEPCFHYPPKYDCRANSTIDYTSLFHHMKHCEDVSKGLRLVNTDH
ncbi:galactoside 2-alpha-L-fucosyltransferase-like [Vicia villosa]|uniref:galactoside 2-alpha-L-fucosyltransferase-like n=1 Tax=Vicia villosa TaxID=3911 RepID=UPI00273AAD52|nr:galactoside 2-alpha-L-fucosyltransferase-like [Vicia villosa]